MKYIMFLDNCITRANLDIFEIKRIQSCWITAIALT